MPAIVDRFAKIFDLLTSFGLACMAAYSFFWLHEVLDAIFYVLAAQFMGRGQVARYLATEIRSELEAMERGE